MHRMDNVGDGGGRDAVELRIIKDTVPLNAGGPGGAQGGSPTKRVGFASGSPDRDFSERLPSEIDKHSVVRYLKKDVSKTQLYKSLPLYLLVLLLISISLILQQKDDPIGYWANTYAKDVLLLSSDEFSKVNSEVAFWNWLERVALTEESGLGISIPADAYVVQVASFSALRQYRGEIHDCTSEPELTAISPHRRRTVPRNCLREYRDYMANTTAYGPRDSAGQPIFRANAELEMAVNALPLEARVGSYTDADNSFTNLLPNAPLSARTSASLTAAREQAIADHDYSRAAALQRQLQHVRGESLLQDCSRSVEVTACGAIPGCHWKADDDYCAADSSRCYGLRGANECAASPDLCEWSGTGCHPGCPRYLSEDMCLVSGCYWNHTNVSSTRCVDATPNVLRILQGLRNNLWVDAQTRAITIEQLLYNPHSTHFIIVTHFIEILPVGVWLPQIRSVPFHLFSLHSVKDRVMFALDIIVTLYIAWSVFAVYLSWRHNVDMLDVCPADPDRTEKKPLCSRLKSKAIAWVRAVDFYIFFEFGFTGLFAAAYTFKWMMWSQGISMTTRSDLTLATPELEADMVVWNDLLDYVILVKREKVVYASAVIFAWLRLFSYVQYNERLNSLTETIKVATGSLISLVIIFFIIFVGFVFAGNLAFGADLREFNTVMRSAGYMTRLLFSAEIDNYDQFRAVESIWSIFFFGLFFSLAWLVLLNMVLAIITSSFNIVKENAKGENGEGKAPSWKLKSVARDIKKFFGRLTSRGQPFAFNTDSVQRAATKSYDYYYDDEGKRRPTHKDASKSNSSSSEDHKVKPLDLVKGNYVIDRIRAIQLLDQESSDEEGTEGQPKSKPLLESSDEEDPEYVTLPELRKKLKHLHPDDVKRIFTKASNETSFGTRALRRGERVAMMINHKMDTVEDKVADVVTRTEGTEALVKEAADELQAIQDELGTGRVREIHAATQNIDYNVYNLPPQMTHNTRLVLEGRLKALQKRMEEPMDDLLDNMDDLMEMLTAPQNPRPVPRPGSAAGVSRAYGGGVTSPPPPPPPHLLAALAANGTPQPYIDSNPIDAEFSTPRNHASSRSNLRSSSDRRSRRTPLEASVVSRTTLVEGVVDVPSAPPSPLAGAASKKGRFSPLP